MREEDTGEAPVDVFELLRSMDMLNHPIHRSCFVGGEVEYTQWSTLPNVYSSTSPITAKDPRTIYALICLDNRKRLLLETDSSYLADYPWDVFEVAEEAARSLDIPLAELVGMCSSNAAGLYNLPW